MILCHTCKNHNGKSTHILLLLQHILFRSFPVYCRGVWHAYTLKKQSQFARTKSHARGWPITLLAIYPMVEVASCLRIFSGFILYSRYLIKTIKHYALQFLECQQYHAYRHKLHLCTCSFKLSVVHAGSRHTELKIILMRTHLILYLKNISESSLYFLFMQSNQKSDSS